MKYVLFIGEVLIVCLAICGVVQLILLLSYIANKRIETQRSQHADEVNAKCEEVLASTAETEAAIREAKEAVGDIPEKYRAEFLEKYDQLEEKIRTIRSDVARIQETFVNKETM